MKGRGRTRYEVRFQASSSLQEMKRAVVCETVVLSRRLGNNATSQTGNITQRTVQRVGGEPRGHQSPNR